METETLERCRFFHVMPAFCRRYMSAVYMYLRPLICLVKFRLKGFSDVICWYAQNHSRFDVARVTAAWSRKLDSHLTSCMHLWRCLMLPHQSWSMWSHYNGSKLMFECSENTKFCTEQCRSRHMWNENVYLCAANGDLPSCRAQNLLLDNRVASKRQGA